LVLSVRLQPHTHVLLDLWCHHQFSSTAASKLAIFLKNGGRRRTRLIFQPAAASAKVCHHSSFMGLLLFALSNSLAADPVKVVPQRYNDNRCAVHAADVYQANACENAYDEYRQEVHDVSTRSSSTNNNRHLTFGPYTRRTRTRRYKEIAYAEYRHVVYDVRDKYKQQSTFGANNQHLAFGPYKRRTRTRI
jgi:hypothetical protein